MSANHSHAQCLVKMDPAIWSQLPFDLLELVASMSDIDSRRALGFKPRRLTLPLDFFPKTMPPIEYRYYCATNTLWYFEMGEYMNFHFDVLTNLELVDRDAPRFRYTDKTRQRRVTFTEEITEVVDAPVDIPNWITDTFQTAGHPIWIA